MIGIPVDRDRWGRSRDIVIVRNANGLQPDEILYAIQHVRFVGGVGLMRVGMPCPQANSGMHSASTLRGAMAAAGLLPFAAAEWGDHVDRRLAQSRPRISNSPSYIVEQFGRTVAISNNLYAGRIRVVLYRLINVRRPHFGWYGSVAVSNLDHGSSFYTRPRKRGHRVARIPFAQKIGLPFRRRGHVP